MITIIPAIDMIGGECVRLTQGDYDRKTSYYKDPLEVALRYADCGIRRLHLVDLDGAKASHPVNLAVLERIVLRTPLEVQYGGGIKSKEALEAVFSSAATMGVEELIEHFRPAGLSQVICTDIAQDGMLIGPSTSLYTKLQAAFPEIDITVSGGIGSWSDIEELDRLGLRSVIVGKAIYEGRISFDQLRVAAR